RHTSTPGISRRGRMTTDGKSGILSRSRSTISTLAEARLSLNSSNLRGGRIMRRISSRLSVAASLIAMLAGTQACGGGGDSGGGSGDDTGSPITDGGGDTSTGDGGGDSKGDGSGDTGGGGDGKADTGGGTDTGGGGDTSTDGGGCTIPSCGPDSDC